MNDIAPHRVQRQAEVVAALGAVLPRHALLWRGEDTGPYECDGLTAYRQLPMVVALPETEEQVRRILQVCSSLKIPVVPRGAGTGLSGGALPLGDVPLVGFFAAGEIGHRHLYGYTGVLTAFLHPQHRET